MNHSNCYPTAVKDWVLHLSTFCCSFLPKLDLISSPNLIWSLSFTGQHLSHPTRIHHWLLPTGKGRSSMSFHSRRYILHSRRRLIRVEAGKRGEVEIGCEVSLQRCKCCFDPGGHDTIASSSFLYLCFLFHTRVHLGHPRKLLGRSGCFCFCVLQREACFSRGTVRFIAPIQTAPGVSKT